MIESGKQLDIIAEKISILTTEIDKRAMLGHTNLNKVCENFVAELLNLVFDFNLENLNKRTANFPGLDLGSITDGIAYQVTSDKTSEKINNELNKCISYEHYKVFPLINFFILSKKQNSYTVKTTLPHFKFDWKVNIQDFDDLLKEINNLNSIKIEKIHNFILRELPYTIDLIKNEQINKSTVSSYLINTAESMKTSSMNYFFHWSCKLSLPELILPVPKLYTELYNFYNNQQNRITFLPVLFKTLETDVTFKRALFHPPIQKHANVSNHFFENALEILTSSITHEFAEYKDRNELITNLTNGINALLSLILFLDMQIKFNQFLLKIDIRMSTNGFLYYTSENSSLSIKPFYAAYHLIDGYFEYSKIMTDATDETLLEIMQSILYGFTLKEKNMITDHPFLEIDEDNSRLVLNYIRKRFGL